MIDDAAPGETDNGIDLSALASTLRREFDSADSFIQRLAVLQRQASQYYEADIAQFPTRVGGSQIILPDVQESIDYMGQSVLRTFISGDRTVEFEATSEQDETLVQQATAAINYNFMRDQDGYRILFDVLHDGLLKKIGVFKTGVETVEKVTRHEIQIADEIQLGMIPEGAEVEHFDEQTGVAGIKHTRRQKKFMDYAIPAGRFLFSPNARNVDDADYLCHAEPRSRSDLVEMGFDRDQVDGLPAYANVWDRQRSESSVLDYNYSDSHQRELEEVLFCEEYARIDLDGDGIAERVKVCRVENEILVNAETGEPSIETIDDHPFSVFSPFPRSHHMVGYSLADKVMDIQQARTFAARQLFEGMAFANMPRTVVDTNFADETTFNDILSPIPGSPIRVKGGAASVQAMQNSFDPAKSLNVMEWLTGERESRTGITRLNQGLDADALNKTATGTALMQAQGQQGEEMVARQMANAVGQMFVKKYHLMRAEAEPFNVKIDGQYTEVDPSQWPEDINVVIRVGLGTNSKDRRIQYRMGLIPLMSEGFMQGMVTPEHTFNMMDGLVQDMGLGKGDEFWVDPKTPEGQQTMQQRAQQPSPGAEAAQAKAQTDQQKLGLQAQTAQAQLAQAERKAQMEIDANREQAFMQAEAAQEKQRAEIALEIHRIDTEADLAARTALLKSHTDVHISANRAGGRLDA